MPFDISKTWSKSQHHIKAKTMIGTDEQEINAMIESLEHIQNVLTNNE